VTINYGGAGVFFLEDNMEQQSTRKHEHLTDAILSAWQEGHGGSAEKAHIFRGEDGIVLMIPKALYEAELNLLRYYSNGAKLLDRYLRSLLETVADDIAVEIQESTQQKLGEAIPLVDLTAGWAIIFYTFKHKTKIAG
jgi:hypothetical protein